MKAKTSNPNLQKYRSFSRYESIKPKKKNRHFFVRRKKGTWFPWLFPRLRRRFRDVTELLWKYTGAKPRRGRFVAAHPLLAPCKNSRSQAFLCPSTPFVSPWRRRHEIIYFIGWIFTESLHWPGFWSIGREVRATPPLEACRSKAGAPVATAFSTRSSYFSACRQAYHYRLDWKHTVLDHPATHDRPRSYPCSRSCELEPLPGHASAS